MIHLTTLRVDDPSDYDVTYAIVRSFKPTSNDMCVFQKAELSPSPELYHWYLQMRDRRMWTQDAFDKVYTPRFIAELVRNPEALLGLSYLYNMSDSGVNLAIGCYCHNVDMCHRCIVGGILLGTGAVVDCKSAYRKYFDMYLEALEHRSEDLPVLL